MNRTKVNVALLCCLLLPLAALASTGGQGISDHENGRTPGYHEEKETLNKEMTRQVGHWDDDQDVSLLVRLKDDSYLENIVSFREWEFEVKATFHSISVVNLKGRAGNIENLLDHPAVERIENDTAVELMMERSLRTINATQVWDSRIREAGSSGTRDNIDGKGVTVVVLDTGIDADHPDLDYAEKTIINLKADIPGGPWHERINTDTSYGHGTHCAGTVAGNGDASAGARRGVAPGANLLGLSVGDIGITLTNVLGGLEWVYEHTKPGANEHNIRVISNSWGTSGREWDPEDAISRICYKLAAENNVVCIFAAGNAGENNHEGTEITTSPYANTPVNVGVAALERDGSGMAYFSSRGQADLTETWPDVGAPGVKIWSAHARKTAISALDKIRGTNPNPYYLAISGTSMATPHVSGLAALMFQACPSLGMSEVHEDWSGTAEYGVEWETAPETRIHEVEEVLELSTVFLASGEGVPEEVSQPGRNSRNMDFAQGYGLVKCDVAVGICLTLRKLRDSYPNRNVTVGEAYDVFFGSEVLYKEDTEVRSEEFTASWEGEYSRWNDITQSGLRDTQNQTKYIYIPNSTDQIKFVMTYQVTSAEDLQTGDLSYEIDVGADGSVNYRGTFDPRMTGVKELDVAVDSDKTGMIWKIDIVGRGLKVPISAFNPDRSYVEIRVEYDASITISAGGTNSTEPPFPLIPGWTDPGMANYYPLDERGSNSAGTASPSKLDVYVYDLDRAILATEGPVKKERKSNWWVYAVITGLALIGMAGVYYLARKRKRSDP